MNVKEVALFAFVRTLVPRNCRVNFVHVKEMKWHDFERAKKESVFYEHFF